MPWSTLPLSICLSLQPLKIGMSALAMGLVASNMAAEPYPDLKQDWFGSDLRYPEFMSSPSFYYLFIYFLSDMSGCFSSIDDESGTTFMFRPFRNQNPKNKDIIYKENLSGLIGVAFIYFSYWVRL